MYFVDMFRVSFQRMFIPHNDVEWFAFILAAVSLPFLSWVAPSMMKIEARRMALQWWKEQGGELGEGSD